MKRRVWDYIFVGSGISTLTHVMYLLKRNPKLQILILEKHNVPGGYCSEFHRPKQSARFDCSMHKLTGMGDKGNLRTLFRELGLDNRISLQFSPVWFSVAGDKNLSLSADPRLTRQTLISRFSSDEEGIDHFFQDVTVHGTNSYMQFEIMLGNYEPNFKELRYAHRHLKTVSVRDAFQSRLKDPMLIEVLSLPTYYIGAFSEQCAYLYFLHVVYASLHRKSAYMTGGSQKLSNYLVEEIDKRGGQVELKVEVEKIIIDEKSGLAKGVDTDKGQFLAHKIVVNTSPLYAIENLLPQSPVLTDHKQRLIEQTPAASTTTVYLVLSAPPASLGLEHAESWVVADDPEDARKARDSARAMPMDENICEDAYWSKSSFEVTNYHLLDSSGGMVVILNSLDDIRHWPSRKTQRYREKKARAADIMIRRLEKHYPNLVAHITYVEVSSPRTYLRYTNNTRGSGYGALVSPTSKPVMINNRFPIDNISFLSAWVSGSGYEATMGYSRMLALSSSIVSNT